MAQNTMSSPGLVSHLPQPNMSETPTNDTLPDVSNHYPPQGHDDYYPWFSIITLAINSIFGTLGNAIVIIVYGLKHSRSPSESFILQLSCLDFIISLFYMPASLYQLVATVDSKLMCLVDRGGALAYVMASFVMFFCIATDRLIAVTKPHSYKTIMTSGRVRQLSVVPAITGVLSAIPVSVSCFTESTSDDVRYITYFMKFYSAVVISLVIFLTGITKLHSINKAICGWSFYV